MNSDSRVSHFTFLACFIVVVIVGVIILYGWQNQWPAILAVLIVFVASIPFYKPVPGRYSLCIMAFILFAYTIVSALLQSELLAYVGEVIAYFGNKVDHTFPTLKPSTTSPLLLILLTFLAYVITVLAPHDNTAMGIHPEKVKGLLDDPQYRKDLDSFCESLKQNLDNLHRELRWSEQWFVPLDAEVEIRHARKGGQRIALLLDALKSNRDQRYILLLGVPGSGKSVALRKLAKDLLGEVKRTSRIPIYMNLRDWRTPSEWTADDPPTVKQIGAGLRRWLFEDLKERLDMYGDRFITRYFEEMERQGLFFFILDSFDEIPLLLEVEERHLLVDRFSEGLARFLGGMHQSRGVLASRLFRKPTPKFAAACILNIRPLSNERIELVARNRSERFDKRLYTEHPELIEIACNPFTAVLLLDYLNANRDGRHLTEFPKNIGDIYEHYLIDRIDYCLEQLQCPKLTYKDLLGALESIADTMFGPCASFDVNISKLPKLVPGFDSQKLLETFKKAHLLRISPGPDPRVSFAHRRFGEYLVACTLLRAGNDPPLEHIPTDSLWRDAMVLYCEIAPENRVQEVATYCWTRMEPLRNQGINASGAARIEGLHCLRFIAEAFRHRPKAIDSFRNELATHVKALVPKGDALLAKWALETVGLFSNETSLEIIHMAVRRDHPWLIETALRTSRNLYQIDSRLFRQFSATIKKMTLFELFVRREKLRFAYGLQPAFQPVNHYLKFITLDRTLLIFQSALVPVLAREPNLWWVVWYEPLLYMLPSERIRGVRWLIDTLGRFWTTLITAGVMLLFYVAILKYLPDLLPSLPTEDHVRKILLWWVIASVPFVLGIWFCRYMFWVAGDVWSTLRKPGRTIDALKTTGYWFAHIVCLFGVIYILWNAETREVAREYRPPSEEDIRNSFLFIVVLFLIGAVSGSFYNAKLLYSDWKVLHKIPEELPEVTREWIASAWNQLRSLSGRKKLISRLQKSEVSGLWPGTPPYTGNDTVSAELARLDERWLGLN